MPHPFKVRQVGKSYVFRYSQCKSDHDGWIHSDYYLPYPYDLVDVRIKRKGKWVEKIKTGWWTG